MTDINKSFRNMREDWHERGIRAMTPEQAKCSVLGAGRARACPELVEGSPERVSQPKAAGRKKVDHAIAPAAKRRHEKARHVSAGM
jgi:hypothetical protein